MGDRLVPDVRVCADIEALAEAAADRVAEVCARALAERGRYLLVLAGGSTPRRAYELLATAGTVDWSRTEIFFGDERCVPPASEASNHRMAREALIDHVSPASVARIRGELPPPLAARRYRQEIANRLGPGLPRFDLVLLGMGADGHTASLFPGGSELQEEDLWAVPSSAPWLPRERVTLTLPVLNAAREVLFVAAGEDKAVALERVLREIGRSADNALPAARVRPVEGRLTWLLDPLAAPTGPPR